MKNKSIKRKSLKKRNKKGGGIIVKKTKKNKSKCSPKNKDNNFSCFSKKSLIKILNQWNNYYGDKIIFSNKNTIQELWNKLDNMLKDKCNSEWCWIEQEFVKQMHDNELSKNTFRPKMPKKWYTHPREWLTTTDIENVMKQYEKKYDDFKFIGPVPIDFDYKPNPGQCIVNELCKINLNNLVNKGMNKLGIVFNLDEHDEPGSHWVALYTDISKGGVYYFDSYGMEPPEEIELLMNRLTSQGKTHNSNMKKYYNKVRHQFKNSECGVYSMHFIINLLEGKTFEDVTKNIIKDDDMLKNRDLYYVKH